MNKQYYQNKIELQNKKITQERRKLNVIWENYKQHCAIKEGTKIVLERTVFDIKIGEEKIEKHNLFIKRVNYNEITKDFSYVFAKITSSGGMSSARCGIYHNIGDKITEIS